MLDLVLVLDAAKIQINRTRFVLGIAVINGIMLIAARTRRAAGRLLFSSATPDFTPLVSTQSKNSQRQHYWLIAPTIIGFTAIIVRTGLEPLSGFDTCFRWDFIAQQLFKLGHLNFYPPIQAEDFSSYAWCDGIAPLVSTLYFWTYLSLGHIEPGVTLPIVLIQAALIFYLVWQLASLRAGPAAGAAACALLATSAAMLWGISMGQETGMTALCALAMYWFIEKKFLQPQARWLLWAGIAAGAGGLAREYGLVLIPLGAITLARHRVSRQGWIEFGVSALAVSIPWYLRNWFITGNPLYPHSIAGLFPTNPIHVSYMQAVGASNAIIPQLFEAVPYLAKLLGLLAAVPLCIGLFTGLRQWRTMGVWLMTTLTFGGVWLASIAQTSGGYIYSVRVLTPAIAMAAVLGGIGLARVVTSRHSWMLAVLLSLVAIDSAERSLFLPIDIQPPWWRIRLLAWRDFGNNTARWRENPNWKAITEAAEGRKVLVSDPDTHAILTQNKAKAVSYFSPEVRFLFGPQTEDLKTNFAHLRKQGFRFIVLPRQNPMITAQLDQQDFFSALKQTTPAATNNLYYIYDIYSL